MTEEKKSMTMAADHHNHMNEKEMMTLPEITSILQEHLPDEIHDSKKYMHMAKSAEEHGNADLAGYLYEMSKDEFTHAEFIHGYLKETGIHIPDEQAVAFEELKYKAERIFR